MSEWKDIESAPKDGTKILMFVDGRIESGEWIEKEEDQLNQMGSDAGWMSDSGFTYPGRSFGNPAYYSDPSMPPTHWMPLPPAPTDNDRRE